MSTPLDEKNLEVDEDFLEVDKPLPGQNYVCLSFISPEKVLKNKKLFYLQKFINDKVLIDRDNLIKLICPEEDLKEAEITHRNSVIASILDNKPCDDILITNVSDEYDNFIFKKQKELDTEFDTENNFCTSTQGIKVRGTYDTLREAQIRAKVLQRKDTSFHVFVGQVGYWLPWDPSAESISNQEYQEDQLNQLVSKYNENMESRDILYEKQIEEKKKKAREENAKIKQKLKEENSEILEIDSEESQENILKLRSIVDEKSKLDRSNQPLTRELLNNTIDKSLNDSLTKSDPWMDRKINNNVEKNLEPINEKINDSIKDGIEDGVVESKDGIEDGVEESKDSDITHTINELDNLDINKNLSNIF